MLPDAEQRLSPREAAHVPRLVIAAPHGRSGKTTLALGLCAALAGRGLAVQPFKKGPDYIDPSWLSAAAGRPCRSLDTFFMPDAHSLWTAFFAGVVGPRLPQADLALIEGNHGLYDSIEDNGAGSTASLARDLAAPVLLVVNAARMTRSVAALVHGYQTFEPGTPIAAVILNNVANRRHEDKLRRAIENHCRIPVVGALPRDENLTIPDRHLGLVPRGEDDGLEPAIAACQEAVERFVALDAVLEITRRSEARTEARQLERELPAVQKTSAGDIVRIAVIKDSAFSFYYPENLEALEDAGAEIIPVSAINDNQLPEVEGLYIGGGFPEMFMDALAENRSFRHSVQAAVLTGLPVYAECGGLMYLGKGIRYQGRLAPMVGALPYSVEMTGRPQGHGYVLGEATVTTPYFPAGSTVRGHEFHHSRICLDEPEQPVVLRLSRGSGIGAQRDGLALGSAYVGYTHLHAASAPTWAPGFCSAARRRRDAARSTAR